MDIRKRMAYCRMIWKKGLLLLPRFVIALVCTAAVLAGAGYAYYKYTDDSQVLPKVKVAIVTAPGDLFTMVGANLVAGMDSVEEICDILFITKEDAEKRMKAGRLDAAVYLTENIYYDISTGENTPVRVQLSSHSSVAQDLFLDLMEDGVSMLRTGEAMVYSLDAVEYDFEANVPIPELMDSVSDQFLSLAVNRGQVWNTQLVSPYGNITLEEFYIMTLILVVACVLFGMGFGGLYDRSSRIVEQCLRRTGIGTVTGTAARISVITAALWVLLSVVCWALGTFTEITEFRPSLLLYLAVLAFSAAGMIHMIYAWLPGSFGTIFYLLFMVLLFVAGGGLFPPAYLPSVLRKAVPFLPVHIWQQYLSGILWGNVSPNTTVKVLCLGAALMIAGSIGMRVVEETSR